MRVIEARQAGMGANEWDRIVSAAPGGHLLQTWAWGELKGEFGWIPWRVAVEQDGAPLAAAQVLYRRIGPLTMAYVPRGPVFHDDQPEVADALWQAIHRHGRSMRSLWLMVEPEWLDTDTQRHVWLKSSGFHPARVTVQPRRTVIVDLGGDEEAILARMKSKWRYNIRLSSRRGVTVREAGSECLAVFYGLMQVTGTRDGFGIHSAAYYERAYRLFAARGRACLLIAEREGEPLGSLMVFAHGSCAYYLYGASADAGREAMPNHQLQWRAMQWARSRGCTQYDLWGISDEGPDAVADSLQGVQRFKEGFGGEIVRYVGAWDYTYSRPGYALAQALWMRRRRAAGQA
ncbi:MAG: lipid II:glycine glycyltransferase FemX [Anaerolineae bacterium]|jgi:peptidoglycan pentaglycine glycine transferase (the first glycine)|nr:peptidoglycan bridge formation glycyltransferase FemA/FemB family protein [Chloroflexota bacterium]